MAAKRKAPRKIVSKKPAKAAPKRERKPRKKAAAPPVVEPTPAEQRPVPPQLVANQWKPGQSGNPAGRKKGSRSKLGEAFLADLHADWEEHGVNALAAVRADKPHEYLKVVASILPKELNVRVDPLEEMDDDELAAILAAARAALRVHQEGRDDAYAPAGAKPH